MALIKLMELLTLTGAVFILSGMSCFAQLPERNKSDASVLTNNNDPGIFFFGNWVLTLNAPGFYFGDYKASNKQYNRCLFTFRGPSVRWFSSKNNNHGLADVYIDEVLQQTVNSYNATLITNALLYQIVPYSLR